MITSARKINPLSADIETIGAKIGGLMATLDGRSATEYNNREWKLFHGENHCVVSVTRDKSTTAIVITDAEYGAQWVLDMSHVNNMMLAIIEDALTAVYIGN